MAETKTRRERLRWRIAYALNRLSGQCWTELVWWASSTARQNRRAGRSALPWQPITESCRNDARVSGDGCCYCAKIGPDGKVRRG